MRFSKTEINHLFLAWIVISLAFSIVSSREYGGLTFSIMLVLNFIISAATVGIGFLLHELAHKYVAQKYGCWAEFRADYQMLVFTILSSFIGFIFAAPGAVFIHGQVTPERNGKISVAGPWTNIVLALGFLLLSAYGLLINSIILRLIAERGFQINSWLALFNMIPLGNLDGAKVWRWNKKTYLATTLVAFLMTFTS
jgi:Zn-dependent protease